MFNVAERDAVRTRVLALARGDRRVVAAAVVGSFALTDGDRWSDLDLTFAVDDGQDLVAVLDDWSAVLAAELGSVVLFDLPSGASRYRVFLFPGALQVDLSVTPVAEFRPRSETFRLLYGTAQPAAATTSRPREELFGHAVHHAVRARVSIERGRPLQAEYWVSALRGEVLALACRRFGLLDWQARGADQLPAEVVVDQAACLVRSLHRAELERALRAAVHALLGERTQAPELADAVTAELLGLVGQRDPAGRVR